MQPGGAASRIVRFLLLACAAGVVAMSFPFAIGHRESVPWMLALAPILVGLRLIRGGHRLAIVAGGVAAWALAVHAVVRAYVKTFIGDAMFVPVVHPPPTWLVLLNVAVLAYGFVALHLLLGERRRAQAAAAVADERPARPGR